MKKMLNRVLALVLAMCMVLGVCPVTALAVDENGKYTVGETFESTDPNAALPTNIVDGTKWGEAVKILRYEHGEHIHTSDCYTKPICAHASDVIILHSSECHVGVWEACGYQYICTKGHSDHRNNKAEGYKVTGIDCKHEHTADCYDTPTCGNLIEHTHNDDCYKYTWTLEWKTYEINWVVDGTTVETDTVTHGNTPSYDGAEPSKAADAQYTYSFTGWSPAVAAATGDTTYTAQFDTTTNTYTVIWKDEGGTVLETDANVPYGTAPTFDGDTPTKEAVGNVEYSFAGWSPAVTADTKVTGNMEFKATYSSAQFYDVKFNTDGGEAVTAQRIEEGKTASEPATKREGYRFLGWYLNDAEYDFRTPVTSDIELTAKWVKQVTVTFNSDGGTAVDSQTFDVNGKANKPADPTKADSSFVGWFLGESAYNFDAAVTGDITLTAKWVGDTNHNGVDDNNEKITVTIDGKAAVTINGQEAPYTYGSKKGENITVVVTPAEGQYVSTVDFGERLLTMEYAGGVATGTKFVQGGSHEVTVWTDTIMSVGAEIAVDYNEYMDKADIQAEVLSKLTTADGVDRSAIKVEYLAYTLPIVNTPVWVEVGEVYKITDDLIVKFSDGHTVRYVYEGSADGKFAGYTVTTIADVADRRADAVISTNSAEKSVDLYDLEKSEKLTYNEEAIRKVFDAVVNAEKNAYPAIAKVTKEGQLLPVYTEGIGSFSGLSEEGVYTITFDFDGSIDFKAAEDVAVKLTIVDNRPETSISLENGTIDMPTLDKVFTEQEILNAVGFESIVSGETVVDGDVAVSVQGVRADDNGCYALEMGKTYEVTVSFAGSNSYKPAEAKAQLTVNDDRIETTVNLKNATVLFDFEEGADNTYEVAEILDKIRTDAALVTSADGDVADTISDVSIQLSNGDTKISEVGTYTVTVSYAGDNAHKPSTATAQFILSDGRESVTIHIKENGEVPYTFWVDEETPGEVLEHHIENYLEVAVTVGEGEELAYVGSSCYDITYSEEPAKMEVGKTYTVTVTINEEGLVDFLPATLTREFTVIDDRAESTVVLKEGQTITYSPDLDEEDIYNLVIDTVTGDEEVPPVIVYKGVTPEEAPALLTSQNMTVDAMGTIHAGTHEVTVRFEGDQDSKPSYATVTVEVTKANASVTVTPATYKYSGSAYSAASQIVVSPADAEAIHFAVGIGFGDSGAGDLGADVYVNLPDLIDDALMAELKAKAEGDGLEAIAAKLAYELALKAEQALEDGISNVASIDDLIELIELVERTAETFEGLNIDLTAVTTLKSVLTEIQSAGGLDNLALHVTMGEESVAVSEAGFYLVGAVVSDANYNTSVGLNYMIISPDGGKCEIEWKYIDENGFFTRGLLTSNEDILGAKATLTGTESWANQADADKYLTEILFGYDVVNNELTLIDLTDGAAEDNLMPGAYTEIAFFRNLGGQMYYDDPVIRPVVVVADMVELRFVDANENNAFLRTFDGTPKAVTAEVYDRSGNRLAAGEQAKITYRYMGVESDGEVYNDTAAPSQTGTYTVVATYNDGTNDIVGVGMAALVIAPAEASIDVATAVVTWKEAPVELDSLITRAPGDAKMAVIMAQVSSVSDFSQEGLAAVEGKIYLDLPNRIDAALKKVGVEGGTYNVTTLLNYLQKAKDLLESAQVDTSALDQIMAELGTIGTEHSVILVNELSEIPNPENLGVYAVIAAVVDNNYIPAIDSGLVIITPEITEAELQWNYNDINGIITRPLIEEANMYASAYVDGDVNDVYTTSIQYVIFGIGEDGEAYSITDPAEIRNLPNGAYTQIAYIPTEIDDEMAIAAPIVREFILVPQTVTVDCTGGSFPYDGEAHPAVVVIRDAAGNEITGELLNNMTVTYTGVGTEGAVSTTGTPVAAGVYGVTAVYKELNDDGSLARFGIGIGQVTIEPARLGYDIQDSVHTYTGGEHEIPINPGEAEHDILFVVDTQNATVNVIAPALGEDKDPDYNWDGDIHIQYWLRQLEEALAQLEGETGVNAREVITGLLEKLPEEITNSDTYKDIMGVLERIDSDELYLNREKPIEPGTYQIYGIAYKNPNYVIEISEGVMTIAEETAVRFPVGEKNIGAGTEIYIDGVPAGTLDDDGILWLEEMPEDGIAVTYSYNKANESSAYPGHYYDVYPTQMYVWEFTLETDKDQPCCQHYVAERVEEMDNILQYLGTSVRLSDGGYNGIRAFSGIPAAAEETLRAGTMPGALNGYELVEYGSVVGLASSVSDPVIGDGTNQNAAAQGSAVSGGLLQYYNGMSPLRDEYIDRDMVVRPYIILYNGSDTITLYGGVIQRSIAYVAWQNRNTYAPGSDLENAEFHGYVWDLIDKSDMEFIDN